MWQSAQYLRAGGIRQDGSGKSGISCYWTKTNRPVFRDILHDLATVVDVRAQDSDTAPTQKRRLDEDLINSQASSTSPFTAHSDQPRNIAGSKRVEQYQQSAMSPASATSETLTDTTFTTSDFDFALPVHSDELGRLPPASDFDFSAMSPTASWTPSFGPFATENPGSHPQSLGSAMQMPGAPQEHQPQPRIDPNLEAIFADLLPAATYEDAFAALTQTQPVYPHTYFTSLPYTQGPVSMPYGGEQGVYSQTQVGVENVPFEEEAPPMWDAGPGSTS